MKRALLPNVAISNFNLYNISAIVNGSELNYFCLLILNVREGQFYFIK